MAEYYAYNAVGSVVANTDQEGFVIRENDFDAYGNVVREQDWTSDNFPTEFGGSQNDLLFSTKERDFSTGLDYFGFRYYDAVLGKFTTRDPIGYPDGPNNYLYCNNNPINKIDPLGLEKLREGERKLTDDEKFQIESMFSDFTSNYDKDDSIYKTMMKIYDIWSQPESEIEFKIVVFAEKNAPGARGFFSTSLEDGTMKLALSESLFKKLSDAKTTTQKENASVRLLGAVVHETVHYLQKRKKHMEIVKEYKIKQAKIDKMFDRGEKRELAQIENYITRSKLNSMDGEFEAHVVHLTIQDIYYKQFNKDTRLRMFEQNVLEDWESNYYDSSSNRSYGANGRLEPNTLIYDPSFKSIEGFKDFTDYIGDKIGKNSSTLKFFEYRDKDTKSFALEKNRKRAWFNDSPKNSDVTKGKSRRLIEKVYK